MTYDPYLLIQPTVNNNYYKYLLLYQNSKLVETNINFEPCVLCIHIF